MMRTMTPTSYKTSVQNINREVLDIFHIHERIATMKNLTDLGSQALELTAGRAAHTQAAALGVLLKDLPTPLRFQVDEAVGAYVAALLEAGFLAGLGVAANPLALLVE